MKMVFDYKFHEWLSQWCGEPYLPWDVNLSFYDEFYQAFQKAPLWDSNGEAALPYIEDIFTLINARFYDWYVLRSADENISANEGLKVAVSIVNVFVNTYEKYSAILNSFYAIKADLMRQVSSSTETGYNDTPQNEGDYTDKEHSTSYTKVTSLTDGATPVERLEQVQNKIRNLKLEWCDEFKQLFWPSEEEDE